MAEQIFSTIDDVKRKWIDTHTTNGTPLPFESIHSYTIHSFWHFRSFLLSFWMKSFLVVVVAYQKTCVIVIKLCLICNTPPSTISIQKHTLNFVLCIPKVCVCVKNYKKMAYSTGFMHVSVCDLVYNGSWYHCLLLL